MPSTNETSRDSLSPGLSPQRPLCLERLPPRVSRLLRPSLRSSRSALGRPREAAPDGQGRPHGASVRPGISRTESFLQGAKHASVLVTRRDLGEELRKQTKMVNGPVGIGGVL